MKVYESLDRQVEVRLNDDEELTEDKLPVGYHLREFVRREHDPKLSREWYEAKQGYNARGDPVNPEWRSYQEPGLKAHTVEGE
jgi:hypothetical protein